MDRQESETARRFERFAEFCNKTGIVLPTLGLAELIPDAITMSPIYLECIRDTNPVALWRIARPEVAAGMERAEQALNQLAERERRIAEEEARLTDKRNALESEKRQNDAAAKELAAREQRVRPFEEWRDMAAALERRRSKWRCQISRIRGRFSRRRRRLADALRRREQRFRRKALVLSILFLGECTFAGAIAISVREVRRNFDRQDRAIFDTRAALDERERTLTEREHALARRDEELKTSAQHAESIAQNREQALEQRTAQLVERSDGLQEWAGILQTHSQEQDRREAEIVRQERAFRERQTAASAHSAGFNVVTIVNPRSTAADVIEVSIGGHLCRFTQAGEAKLLLRPGRNGYTINARHTFVDTGRRQVTASGTIEVVGDQTFVLAGSLFNPTLIPGAR